MRTAAQRAGDDAEARVAAYLDRRWAGRCSRRNVRVGRAELDLVARDPGPPAALVIVEVRWRSRRDFGLPEETVDGRKRARLHRAGFALRELGKLPDGRAVPRAAAALRPRRRRAERSVASPPARWLARSSVREQNAQRALWRRKAGIGQLEVAIRTRVYFQPERRSVPSVGGGVFRGRSAQAPSSHRTLGVPGAFGTALAFVT